MGHYHILHDGEILRWKLENLPETFPDLPDDYPEREGYSRFTRPRTGPVVVYYNPAVDIVLLTEGLEGLSVTPARRWPYHEAVYRPSFGYDLSIVENLGMLWTNTGAACPVDSGRPSDFEYPWLRSYANRRRRDTAYSVEINQWMGDFVWFLHGAHTPLPRRIVLLDMLNTHPRSTGNVGYGIDLFPHDPSDIWHDDALDIPQELCEAIDKGLAWELDSAHARADSEDSDNGEHLLQLEVGLCKVRSRPV